MKWGCRIENIVIEKGSFKFRVSGTLNLDSSLKKIPIIGKTGSGKSSLLKAIFGLEDIKEGEVVWSFPDNKKIVIKSQNIEEIDKIRDEYFGFAFQNSTLIDYLTVKENLIYPLLLTKKSKQEAIDIINSKIEMYLTGSEKREVILSQFPNDLSGGQRQRISLLQSVIHNPYVLLADEPTGSLDEETREQIMELLYKWVDENKNRLLIWITHHNQDQINSGAIKVLKVENQSCKLRNI